MTLICASCFPVFLFFISCSSYLDAAKNVMTLFQHRGWTSIITDDLVENVLTMMSVGIGLITGLVGLIIGATDQNVFAGMGLDSPQLAGFVYVSLRLVMRGCALLLIPAI